MVPIESCVRSCAAASPRNSANHASRLLGRRRGRRHRCEPADVVAQIRSDLLGCDTRLRRLAGEVDLKERRHLEPPGRGVGVQRVDELADPVDDLDLVRLKVADEVPAEGVAVGGVLRFQILRSVLADDGDPRLDQRRHARRRRRTSSRRRSSPPAPPRTGCARTARGSRQATAPITPWTPRASPSRRCEKKSSGWSCVQRSTRSTCSTPALRRTRSAADHRSRRPSRVRSAS